MSTGKEDVDEAVLEDDLTALAKQAALVSSVERELSRQRGRRDQMIRRAVGHGASERAAASHARVSPSYAHAAAKNGGLTASVLRERHALSATRARTQ